jgi:hypothetical protein
MLVLQDYFGPTGLLSSPIGQTYRTDVSPIGLFRSYTGLLSSSIGQTHRTDVSPTGLFRSYRIPFKSYRTVIQDYFGPTGFLLSPTGESFWTYRNPAGSIGFL